MFSVLPTENISQIETTPHRLTEFAKILVSDYTFLQQIENKIEESFINMLEGSFENEWREALWVR